MQCYVVVYNKPYGMVFVAFKKIKGARFEGIPSTPTVLNYSGQLVFPGGAADGDDAQTGALREFTEETGVDLTKYIDDGKFETKTFSDNGSYAATYCEIDGDYMQALVEACNANVHHGETDDDELFQLGFLPMRTAYGALMTWDSSLTTKAAEKVLSRRSKYAFDKSWFKAIMDHLATIVTR